MPGSLPVWVWDSVVKEQSKPSANVEFASDNWMVAKSVFPLVSWARKVAHTAHQIARPHQKNLKYFDCAQTLELRGLARWG